MQHYDKIDLRLRLTFIDLRNKNPYLTHFTIDRPLALNNGVQNSATLVNTVFHLSKQCYTC
jgi:hypothetical protein